MKSIWFTQKDWFYHPSFVLILATLGVCSYRFYTIDQNSYSNSDTVSRIFPFFVSAISLLFWFPKNTSEKN